MKHKNEWTFDGKIHRCKTGFVQASVLHARPHSFSLSINLGGVRFNTPVDSSVSVDSAKQRAGRTATKVNRALGVED